MRIILSVLFAVSFYLNPHFSMAQCATEPLDSASFESQPWFANPAYLINLRDSLTLVYQSDSVTNLNKSNFDLSNINGGFDQDARYWIPVKAHVIHNDNGDNGVPREEIDEAIIRLNEHFSGDARRFLNGNMHFGSLIPISSSI